MKKTLAIILLSAILLTACDNTEKNNSDNSDSSVSQTSSSADESSDNDESSNADSGKWYFSDIEKLGMETFTDVLGETVSLYDAVDGYYYYEDSDTLALKFDFGFIRYARPYYYETAISGDFQENMDRIDSEQNPVIDALPELEWFKVQKGDKLDCGLTVKNVEYNIIPEYMFEGYSGWMKEERIDFDGKLTLEGYLYCVKSSDYLLSAGDVLFYPDISDISGIPVILPYYDDIPSDYIFSTFLETKDGDVYISSDIGDAWYLGSKNEGFDTSIFGGEEAVKVKVTLNNIYALAQDSGLPAFGRINADVDEIEPI